MEETDETAKEDTKEVATGCLEEFCGRCGRHHVGRNTEEYELEYGNQVDTDIVEGGRFHWNDFVVLFNLSK